MKKRLHIKEGDIFSIMLSDNTYCYGRVLKNPYYAFYNLNSKVQIIDLNLIVSSSILFKLAVMNYALKSDNWEIIGNLPLPDSLKEPPIFYNGGGDDFVLAFWDGRTVPSTYEECKDLEMESVWSPEHVESRLEDYYAGRKNVWVEMLKAKKPSR